MNSKISLNNLYVGIIGTVIEGSYSGAYMNVFEPANGYYIHLEPEKYVFVKRGIILKSKITDAISKEKYDSYSEDSEPGNVYVSVQHPFKQVLLEYAPEEIRDKHLKNNYLTIDDAIHYLEVLNSYDIALKKSRYLSRPGDLTFEEYTDFVRAHL